MPEVDPVGRAVDLPLCVSWVDALDDHRSHPTAALARADRGMTGWPERISGSVIW
jgi:hypothetical protein